MATYDDPEYWEQQLSKYQRSAPRATRLSVECYRGPDTNETTTLNKPEKEVGPKDSRDKTAKPLVKTEPSEDLSDWVEFTNPLNGEVILWNAVEGRWRKANETILTDKPPPELDADVHQKRQHAARNSKILMDDESVPPILNILFSEDEIQSLDDVAELMKRMVERLGRVADSGTLSADKADQLVEVKEKLERVYGSLALQCPDQLAQLAKEEDKAIDGRNDVDALLDFGKHKKWDFNNEMVDWYRATSLKRNHGQWGYQDWHKPEFFSTKAIPLERPSVKAIIIVPTGLGMDPDERVVVELKDGDTFERHIPVCLQKVKSGSKTPTDYILQSNGWMEFCSTENNPYSYDCVRKQVRDGYEVCLKLVKKPSKTADPSSAQVCKNEYMGKTTKDIKTLDEATYMDVSSVGVALSALQFIPMKECEVPFRVKVIGIDYLTSRAFPTLGADTSPTHLSIQAMLLHGTQVLKNAEETTMKQDYGGSPRWLQWLFESSGHMVTFLPRETRLAFIVNAHTAENKVIPLGWVSHQLVDHQGRLSSGQISLRLWGFPAHKKKRRDPKFIFRATNRENLSIIDPAILQLQFDSFVCPVVAPITELNVGSTLPPSPPTSNTDSKTAKALKSLRSVDALYQLTDDNKKLLWQMRHSVTDCPSLLPKFLQCVDWGDREQKMQAHETLKMWCPLRAQCHYMQLLDVTFADYTVRKFAITALEKISDEELQGLLLQLTQCIKFEPYHDSPLSRWLIERAIRSPFVVGHYFFWSLKSELHEPFFAERFGVILEEYLSHCGRFAGELRKQNAACLKLQRVAAMVVKMTRAGEDACTAYHHELHRLNKDFFEPLGSWSLPIDPKWQVTTLQVEKCHYMSSKMVPLWLCFNKPNTQETCLILFKSGDDLRQDILTLQLLNMMDQFWLSDPDPLDMKLRPYKCIATGVNENGDGVGMIEIVDRSETTSGIQLKYGGTMGAFRMSPIDMFLKEHNQGKDDYEAAVQNFLCSCAGYCVATFVLGIGDRHNGNIMVTRDGHLFHIDFGHFLGNFKTKFGVKRERAAFVFTPEMAYVIGGRKYKKTPVFKQFLQKFARAFQMLRGHADTLEILFMLMVSAGMPELTVETDIHYLRDKLYLEMDATKAEKEVENELFKSLKTTFRRLDNMIHNIKHG